MGPFKGLVKRGEDRSGRLVSALEMEGALVHHLMVGGAYDSYEGGLEQARTLCREFVTAVLEDRPSDPVETAEWLDSLKYVLGSKGPERAKYLLHVLEQFARRAGVDLPIASNTPSGVAFR